MILAEGVEGRNGGLDHGHIVGAQDEVEDLQNGRGEQRQVFGALLDEGLENLEGDLDISAGCGKLAACLVYHEYIGVIVLFSDIPDAQAPDIAGGPLLEKAADLLNLGLARGSVK